MFRMNVLWNMNTCNGIQLCIFLVWCPSDSHLAILFVDYCKWLVYVASLLAPKPHLLLSFILNRLDIVKTLPGCFLQTYVEEPDFSCKKSTGSNNTQSPLNCSNEGHGSFHSSKRNSRCLKHVLAFSGQNQTYNLINMFRMNVLWNMNTCNGIQLCIFLVWCPSDSHLAILFVDYCKWLVYVASLLAPKPHLLLFFVLNKLDIVKTLPGCFLQTYIKEPVFSCKKSTGSNNTESPLML